MRRLKNILRNINKNPNVNRFLDMSRRRKTNGKANNSNLVGLVATVTNVENVNVGKRVVIQEVNNDIAKVFLLDDKKMNKFYLPVSDLRIFSRERSQKYLLENVIDGFMSVVNKAINGDEVKRYSDKISLRQELDNIAECFGEFSKWREINFGGNANNEPIFEEPKDDHEEDTESNYCNHILQCRDLFAKCSEFCRDNNVSPMLFVSKLSEHLYAMHERYAPKDKK